MLLYQEYVKTNEVPFIAEVRRVAGLLKIDPNHLMLVMYAESRLNEKAVNPISNATGLIQFMPATAHGLGTTVQYLKTLTNVAQMKYVYQYFKPYAGKMKTVYDVYKVVFFPVSLGKPTDWVFQTASLNAGLIARQNPAIDINKDGQITVSEFEAYIDTYLKKKSIFKQ